jgi:hypothetical protein
MHMVGQAPRRHRGIARSQGRHCQPPSTSVDSSTSITKRHRYMTLVCELEQATIEYMVGQSTRGARACSSVRNRQLSRCRHKKRRLEVGSARRHTDDAAQQIHPRANPRVENDGLTVPGYFANLTPGCQRCPY